MYCVFVVRLMQDVSPHAELLAQRAYTQNYGNATSDVQAVIARIAQSVLPVVIGCTCMSGLRLRTSSSSPPASQGSTAPLTKFG